MSLYNNNYNNDINNNHNNNIDNNNYHYLTLVSIFDQFIFNILHLITTLLHIKGEITLKTEC